MAETNKIGGASLERLDQIRDTLIERGLGTSNLLKQAVQRAGLPELSSALATATAIRRSEQVEREKKIKSLQSANLAASLRARGGEQSDLFAPLKGLVFSKGAPGVSPQVLAAQNIGGRVVTKALSESEARSQGIDLLSLPDIEGGNVFLGGSSTLEGIAGLLRQFFQQGDLSNQLKAKTAFGNLKGN